MPCVSDRSPPKAAPALITIMLAAAAFLAGATVTARAERAAPTHVIADEAGGTVRIVVNGKDVVVIDAAGLHVNGALTYTDTLTDSGTTP
jgi:hypothetical protein